MENFNMMLNIFLLLKFILFNIIEYKNINFNILININLLSIRLLFIN